MPHKQAELLSAHRLFQTTDVDAARAAVAQKFCAHDLLPGSNHRQFDVCHNHVAGAGLSLNYLRYGCDVKINPGELTHFYLIQIPLSGTALVQNGRKQVAASDKTASVLNPTRETRMLWNKGCEKLLLQIDRDTLTRTAETLIGKTLPCPVVFDPWVELNAPELRKWLENLWSACRLAQRGLAFGQKPPKHQALIEEELITGFLLAQPSTISHLLAVQPGLVSCKQMHRARLFIMEKLTEPMTISQIAEAAGCSVRSLQLGFQKQFACTPKQYLKTQQLNHAHLLLQSLPPDTLVSDIAFDSGFSHLGRFSVDYRKSFGRTPRESQIAGSIC